MTSAAVAALVAHLGFWTLLVYGWFWEEIGLRGVTIFLLLWAAGWVALSYVADAHTLFSSYVALLDIVLVFVIFKGDVKLT